MSFLAPLFLAGLAALSLPILFHLIRRTPESHQTFSSLMFLSPSPPRLTRRSRLDQILLLLLRAAVLALLAMAFARPFLREASQLAFASGAGRQVAVLVDTSASMRRGDLWAQAVAKVEHHLDAAAPEDHVALFAFDDDVREIVSFDAWKETPHEQRAALVKERLAQLSPTWGACDLGAAIANVADSLEDAGDQSEPDRDRARQMVLVSDMAGGSKLDALGEYEWPATVRLAVEQVKLPQSTNAGLHALAIVADDDEDEENADDSSQRLRVRVTNDADSTRDEFRLAWAGDDAAAAIAAAAQGASVYVPAGQSRVVRSPKRPSNQVDRLVLEGDDHPFDNTLYVSPRATFEAQLVFIGDDRADDPDALRFYVERAVDTTPSRTVTHVGVVGGEPIGPSIERGRAAVVAAGRLSSDQTRWLVEHASAGGRVVYVVESADDRDTLAALLGNDQVQVAEAETDDYALLADIDFRHAVFAPFADPRFSDFTKIHFWQHRKVDLPTVGWGNAPAANDRGQGTGNRGQGAEVGDREQGTGNRSDKAAAAGAKATPLASEASEVEAAIAELYALKNAKAPGEMLYPMLYPSNPKSKIQNPKSPTVLASFDDGSPFVIERALGSGAIYVVTSGWRPDDSQWAMSTKFVPMIAGLLAMRGGALESSIDYKVGQAAPLVDQHGQRTIVLPDGRRQPLPAGAAEFAGTHEPGLYRVEMAPAAGATIEPAYFAVNVSPSESRVAPLAVDELEQLGVKLGAQPSRAERAERERQLRDVELESQQKLWRWAIAAALVVLLVETFLAGWFARPARSVSPGVA